MDRQAAIDLIIDHFEHPRHYGLLDDATFQAEGTNTGCGDVVRISARVGAEGRLEALTFEGEGCTISQAAASVLTELAAGRTLGEVLAMGEDELAEAMGGEVVRSRLPCVSLALRVLQSGIRAHLNGDGTAPDGAE